MIGKCNCGSVSFEITGSVPALYHCYCTLCQKQGGTASNAGAIVFLEKFTWLSGESNVQKWKKDTGFSSHFCNVCGSPVPNIFKGKYVWVPVGLLENMSSKAVANIWLESRPAWASPTELERNYDSAPDDIEEFVQYLNSGK